jgi:hypothetical protein
MLPSAEERLKKETTNEENAMKEEVGLQDRLERIEREIREMHRALVRLEGRLERADLLPGEQWSDQKLFASENSIESPSEEQESVSDEDVSKVMSWLERHEQDSKIGFDDIEKEFGREKRLMLLNVLAYLNLGHQYEELIGRIVNGKGPTEAKSILRDHFKHWRRKR